MKIRIYILLLLGSVLWGCHSVPEPDLYRVGVCLDKSDEWHDKMCDEIVQEAVLFPDMELTLVNAHDQPQRQSVLLDSLLASDVDLMIVCVEDPMSIRSSLQSAMYAQVPVVINAHNPQVSEYTAYVGMNNIAVGELMAVYAKDIAQNEGYSAKHPLCVVELMGEIGVPAVVERYEGLRQGLHGVDNVALVGSVCGDWEKNKAQDVVDSLLDCVPQIDIILAQNDMMALGAAQAIAQRGRQGIRILGVDAQSGKGRGIEAILDGTITASITNETRGDLLIKTAAAILHHEPYVRDSLLTPMLVDGSSTTLMRRMTQEMADENKVIQTLQLKVDHLWGQKQTLQSANWLLGLCLISTTLLIILLIVTYLFRARTRSKLEQISAELERVSTLQDKNTQWLEKLKQEIEIHASDSEYSVDNLCAQLHVSRAQLFRKVKEATGATPLELIRQVRLTKARQLLQETDMTIQQVCYSVGYTLPSYFSRSYKEYFGILPSQEHRPLMK